MSPISKRMLSTKSGKSSISPISHQKLRMSMKNHSNIEKGTRVMRNRITEKSVRKKSLSDRPRRVNKKKNNGNRSRKSKRNIVVKIILV